MSNLRCIPLKDLLLSKSEMVKLCTNYIKLKGSIQHYKIDDSEYMVCYDKDGDLHNFVIEGVEKDKPLYLTKRYKNKLPKKYEELFKNGGEVSYSEVKTANNSSEYMTLNSNSHTAFVYNPNNVSTIWD